VAERRPEFDPFRVLRTFDQHDVTYIVIGALGRVIHGSDELTDGIDVVPATNEKNLRRLALALDGLNACRADGTKSSLERDLARKHVLELQTDAGKLKIVPEPVGTRGYGDLRWHANREALGNGLRPSVASIHDHARMLAALDRPQDRTLLLALRRLIELQRELLHG
jgi:hypothetical protein